MIIWIHGGLLLQLLHDELAARSLHPLLLVRGGVVAQLLAVGQALLGTTQTGSYQTGSYQKGRFTPPKPKRLHF